VKTVCFTGRGVIDGPTLSGYNTSKFHERDWWNTLAGDAGFHVVEKVDTRTDYLVASRIDTKKAIAARQIGIQVMTYYDFHVMVKAQGLIGKQWHHEYFEEAGEPEPAVQVYDTNQDLPGWGSF
jgi:hypothetical protein